MERLWKYCLSLNVAIVIVGCFDVVKNDYHMMPADERRRLSADYTQLARHMQAGSPEAMRTLEKAARIDPNNDLAWRELSRPYLSVGMIAEWNDHMERAVLLNPQAWQAWRGYHKLFYFRDYGGALFDFDLTDTLTVGQTDYPMNRSVDYLRGLCYLGLKNHEKAIEYFNIYIDDETQKVGAPYVDETAFLYLGIIAYREKEYDLALNHFNRAVQYEEGTADMYFHRSRTRLKLGDLPGAKQDFEKARTLFDDGRYHQGYDFEMPEQLYKSDLNAFEEILIP